MKRCNKHRHQSGKFTSLWPSAHNVPRQHATAVSQVPSSRFPTCAVGPQTLAINPLPQSLSACAPHPLDPQAILSGQLTKGSVDGENVTAFAQAKCNSPGPAFHCEHGPTTSDYHFKRPDCYSEEFQSSMPQTSNRHSVARRMAARAAQPARRPPPHTRCASHHEPARSGASNGSATAATVTRPTSPAITDAATLGVPSATP